jgi:hypothetical protein
MKICRAKIDFYSSVEDDAWVLFQGGLCKALAKVLTCAFLPKECGVLCSGLSDEQS